MKRLAFSGGTIVAAAAVAWAVDFAEPRSGVAAAPTSTIAAPARPQAKAPLKQRLKSGELATGAFLGMLAGGPAAQFLAAQGLDYFIIDLEHYTFDPVQVREMITAARYAGIAPIVRVGAPTQEVTRWLDAGAEGIVIPMVEDPKQAEALVHFGRYQPEGDRGASSMNGHTDFSRPSDWPALFARRNKEVMLLVMIESPKGLANADRILSVPGIDGAIIGTGDYSVSAGIAGQVDHPKVMAAAEKLIAICRARGKLVSVPIRKPENAARWVEAGLNMLTFVDLSMISQGIQLNLRAIEAARSAKAGGAFRRPSP